MFGIPGLRISRPLEWTKIGQSGMLSGSLHYVRLQSFLSMFNNNAFRLRGIESN